MTEKKLYTVTLRITPAEFKELVSHDKCRTMGGGDMFKERGFWMREADHLQCMLKNIEDNPIDSAKELAAQGLSDHRSRVQAFHLQHNS